MKNYNCSFVKRFRKLSLNQIKYIEKFSNIFLIPYKKENINFNNFFLKKNKIILEIGFGNGEVTAKIAELMPKKNFICIDIYERGIFNLLKIINKKMLLNIKIIKYDAIYILNNMIKPFSIFGVHIFFPDPWEKNRHKKRRFINEYSIRLIVLSLEINGYIHITTDSENYAKCILEILISNISLKNISKNNSFISKDLKPNYRFITKFENKSLILGKKIFDLIFIKIK